MTAEPGIRSGVAVRKVLVVANPMARRNAPRLISDLKAAAPADIDWQIIETSARPFASGELEEIAGGADLVVAVGGDGTVTETLSAIGNCRAPLAILAGGSTNVIAKELGIPGDPESLARMLFGGHSVRTIDAATCNGRMFLHMAGAGFDSRIFDQTNPELKRRAGWFAYLPSAARSLRLPPARFHVETEFAQFDLTSPMVLIANGAGIIRPNLYIFPGISSSDGWLDLVAVTATRGTAIAGVLARFASRSMDRSPHILHARARSIKIESVPAMPVQVDGDVIGSTPVEIEIQPGRARFLVPKAAPTSASGMEVIPEG
jgi:diacylglycerol kinase (ATP)